MSFKPAIAAGITACILLAASDCSQIVTAVADSESTIQILSVPNGIQLNTLDFSRGTYEIITVAPWLKPENKNYKLSDSELISILKKAGFTGNGLRMAWAIAFHESTNRPFALNKASNCYGLFQINMNGAMGPDRRAKYELDADTDLFDPYVNAAIAFDMSNGGTRWTAWEAYSLAKKTVFSFPG